MRLLSHLSPMRLAVWAAYPATRHKNIGLDITRKRINDDNDEYDVVDNKITMNNNFDDIYDFDG